MTLLKEATDFFPEKLEQLEQIEWNMAELWQVTHVNELDFMSWLQVGTVRFDSVSEILPFWHEMILWPSWAAMDITMASTNRCKQENPWNSSIFYSVVLHSIAEDRGNWLYNTLYNIFIFLWNFWLHMLVQRFWRRSKNLCLNFKIIFQFAFFDRLGFRTCVADSRVVSGWQLQPQYWTFSLFYCGFISSSALLNSNIFNQLATETHWAAACQRRCRLQSLNFHSKGAIRFQLFHPNYEYFWFCKFGISWL